MEEVLEVAEVDVVALSSCITYHRHESAVAYHNNSNNKENNNAMVIESSTRGERQGFSAAIMSYR